MTVLSAARAAARRQDEQLVTLVVDPSATERRWPEATVAARPRAVPNWVLPVMRASSPSTVP